MQTKMPTTTEQWEGVVTELSTRRQAIEGRMAELRHRKADLALAAALGDLSAERQLEKTNAELAKAAADLDALQTASAQATSRRQEAEQAVAANAERQRRAQISEAVAVYLDDVHEIDAALLLLQARFATAKQALDRAEVLMTAQERQPLQQLRSPWGSTLAAAHYGLGEHLSLGRESMHRASHGATLEAYTLPFVEPWNAENGGGPPCPKD